VALKGEKKLGAKRQQEKGVTLDIPLATKMGSWGAETIKRKRVKTLKAQPLCWGCVRQKRVR